MVKDERSLVSQIRSIFSSLVREDVVLGIGDDCAVLDLGLENDFLLLGSDSIVEGVHFVFNSRDKSLIGRKAVGSVLSDIAAMGGYPLWITIDVGIPSYVDWRDLEEVLEGTKFLLNLFSVSVVGGDTVKSSDFFLSVSCVGKVEKDRLVTRSGARKGDWIWVTGPLGGSRYGRHLLVSPRIPEARFLVQNFSPSAMIDISDGLVLDLYRVLEASGVVGEIVKEKIPIHKDARDWEEALYMGEDFELLFCLSEGESRRLLSGMGSYPYKFYCIGKVVDRGSVGLYLREGRHCYPLSPKGFQHF